MSEDPLTAQFEAHRTHLRTVAYRMLGSVAEAEDAVQEAWLRLDRTDTSDVANLGGWLTTVVARVCLTMLQSRKSRREDPIGSQLPDPVAGHHDGPEHEAVLADSVGLALLVVLDQLAPAERLAFVLHDLFAVPFEEIAPIVERTPTAARQLASRARRRVQGATTTPDLVRQREIVDAFLAAARGGDFDALLELLDPEIVLRADAATIRMGSDNETRGRHAVAETFSGRARGARTAIVDGAVGAVWMQGGRPRVVFGFTVIAGKIVEIELLSNPDYLAEAEVEFLG
jgi:RNA polymerase sigma factor (sigma-70 family)